MTTLEAIAKEALKKRQPATVSVAQALREAILMGVLKSGIPLRQDALGKQFGVSQVTVHEALRLLSEEGLVQVIPRRGAVVYTLSADEAAEITSLRMNLEGVLISEAIPQLTSLDLAEAHRVIEAIDQADSPEALIGLNVDFHALLYAKAKRPRTEAIVERLRVALEPYLRLLWTRTGYQSNSQKDHREILDLCKRKKIPEARKVLESHIEKTGKQIEELLRAVSKEGG
ncbi:GntR family transcriptional regulator [Polaromonas sp. P1(28)-8]|nr:GntR family transcriptional regulator [Polaromonas sp. P1(28)-8]